LAAGLAEVDREAEEVGVAERIVGSDGRDLLPALLLDHVAAQAVAPLGTIGMEAEEVRRRIDIGGLERAGSRVDDRLGRNRLGVVAQRNAFRAGKRSDDEVDLILLDELAGFADRAIRR